MQPKKKQIDEAEIKDLKLIIVSSVDAVSKDEGWAPLSGVGGYINKNYPSFDSRNYGFEKLGKLVSSLDYIEIDKRKFDEGPSNIHIFVRVKNV